MDCVHRFKDMPVKHIDAYQRQVAGRVGGFFYQLRDAAIRAQFGHAISRGIFHFLQDNLAVPVACCEVADELADAALDDIVAQEHHKGIITQEVARDFDGVRQAIRAVLVNVSERDIPLRAIAQRGADFGRGMPDHDADFAHARFTNGFDDAHQHRLVGDGDELLGAGIGQRIEPCAFAATEDESLHRRAQ